MALSLSQIDQGIDALLENAAALIAESRTLAENGAYARSFSLAHLAREESARVTMLQAAAVRVLAGHPVDWKRLMVRLKDHKSKLKLETVEGALFLLGSGQDEGGNNALSLAEGIAGYRNDIKNASLYVGFVDGRFTNPKDSINERVAHRTLELAEMRLDFLRKVRSKIPSYESRSAEGVPQLKEFDPEKIPEILPEIAAVYAQILRVLYPDHEIDAPKSDNRTAD